VIPSNFLFWPEGLHEVVIVVVVLWVCVCRYALNLLVTGFVGMMMKILVIVVVDKC
jgi:hypothetical protein